MARNVQVSSTITLNQSALDNLTKQQYMSLSETADALLTDLRDNQLMPFDTGNMQNDSTAIDDSMRMSGQVSIVTTAPQARRLYFHPEYNFRRNNNSNAGGRWWDSYISGSNSAKPAQFYAQIFKRNGGLT